MSRKGQAVCKPPDLRKETSLKKPHGFSERARKVPVSERFYHQDQTEQGHLSWSNQLLGSRGSRRFTFYILLCKGGPLEISPEVSSPLRQHSTLLLNLVFILNTERKTPAFSLSENQPPRLPLQPRVFSYCTIMNHASVRNIISSPGEEQNVWNRICIKHALTGRKGGCLVGENYRVSV